MREFNVSKMNAYTITRDLVRNICAVTIERARV